MSPRLQFLQSLSISVGMAFATSCFAMVSGMATAAGPWAIAAIGIGVLIALTVAQAIGKLARRFPSALGIRTYIKAAFGNTASLFFVFLYLFMIVLIAGVESNLFAGTVRYVFPALDTQPVVIVLFALVVAMNIFGYEFSKNTQLIMVAAMLTGVLALAVYGIASVNLVEAFRQQTTGGQFAALPATVISAFFLFVGFEWVTSMQSGSRSAASQLPYVLVTSVVLLGVVYILFSAAVVTNLDHAQLAGTDRPQMLLAQKFWGTAGTWIVLLISSLAVLTSFNAGVLGAARLVYSLARERVLPEILGTTAAFSGAPIAAIAAITLVSLASALAAMYIRDNYLLGNAAAAIICICYSGLLAASLRLDKRSAPSAKPHPARAQRVASVTALVLMGLLLATLLFHENTLRQAVIVVMAIGFTLLLAFAANQRTLRTA